MQFTIANILALATSVSAVAIGEVKRSGASVSVTPHAQYGSSVGVLGCKIESNRAAYWPSSVSCDNICLKVSANGRSVNLLKIDQSGGAYDISYDAWNYLMVGKSAAEDPQMGGGLDATYEDVPMSECEHLLYTSDKTLPLEAANSMNYLASCLGDTWVGQHYSLHNIMNAVCTYGVDEPCTLDMAVSNQPSCQNSVLGVNTPLSVNPGVWNIVYGTGKYEKALS